MHSCLKRNQKPHLSLNWLLLYRSPKMVFLPCHPISSILKSAVRILSRIAPQKMSLSHFQGSRGSDRSNAARRLLPVLSVSLAGEIKCYNERLITWSHASGGVHHNSSVDHESLLSSFDRPFVCVRILADLFCL